MKKELKVKVIKNKLNRKRGSELVQTVLITAIMIVIVATMFYPGIQGVFNDFGNCFGNPLNNFPTMWSKK